MTVRPLHVAIRRISVSAASVVEARRLGDALPQAIERALAPVLAGQPAPVAAPARSLSAADQAAATIAEAVAARLRGGR
ncbi:MAG TPA: hypothetical protein VGB08_05480 [Allosphingosinicella sp.]|jgi:hypothetical protein